MMFFRAVAFLLVAFVGYCALCATWAAIDSTNEAYRIERINK